MFMVKPIKINFDSDIFDAKTALSAYLILMRREYVAPILNSKVVGLESILRDKNIPGLGFKEEILPSHLNNITYFEDRYVISYNGKLDHDLEQKYWESKGYSARKINNSTEILTPNGDLLAKYGINRILIPKEQVETFILHMR